MNTVVPIKGQIRKREWQNWWFAERWNGLRWEHIYGAPSEENLEYWLEFIRPHESIDTSASD